MAEEKKGRAPIEFLFDALKPRIERAVREHGGRVVLALPGIGDALIAALRVMGPKAFGEAVMMAGGVINIERKRFPAGHLGDSLHELVNEIIDELGQAIAHEGESATPERMHGLVEQIIGRRAGKAGPASGGKEMDPEVNLESRTDPRGGVQLVIHILNCVLPKSKKKIRDKNSGREIEVDNCRKMLLSEARAQGGREDVCGCARALPKELAKREEKTPIGRKRPLEIIGELSDAERTTLMGRIAAQTRADQGRVWSEFEKRLTSVTELRSILAFPPDQFMRGIDLLKDAVQERAEKAVARIGEVLTHSRTEIRAGATNAAGAMNGLAARLRERAASRRP